MQILRLPFENDSLADVSGNGHDGTANGGAFVDGVIGRGWSNGGNSRILVPYSAPLYPGNAMTFACWINLASTTFAATAYHVAMYETGKRMWAITQAAGTGQNLTLFVSTVTSANVHSFGVALATGWTHLAVTANNTTKKWRLYLNGVFITEVTSSYSYTDARSALTIGGNTGGTYSNGVFDDIRFENRILSASEIKAIVASGRGTELAEPWVAARLLRGGD